MSKGAKDTPETPQQRAMVQYAMEQMADYKQRWLPVQQRLAAQVQEMGKAGSVERTMAAGRATTDTTMKFGQAQGALERSLANGVGLGSSRAKLGITGLGEDRARSTGLGMTAANQQVDEAYTQALAALAATGRGEKAQIGDSLSRQASKSGIQAEADAAMALTNRMGNAQMAGQFAGLGMQQALAKQQRQTAPGAAETAALPFSSPPKSSGFGMGGGGEW